MDESPEHIRWRDEEHLRLLSLFHYIFAGVYAFFALIPILHFGLGVMLAFSSESMFPPDEGPPPRFIGYILMGVAGAIILLGETFACLTAWSGYNIKLRRYRAASVVLGGFNVLSVPFGTLLGIFTIITLERKSVRQLYEDAHRARIETAR